MGRDGSLTGCENVCVCVGVRARACVFEEGVHISHTQSQAIKGLHRFDLGHSHANFQYCKVHFSFALSFQIETAS